MNLRFPEVGKESSARTTLAASRTWYLVWVEQQESLFEAAPPEEGVAILDDKQIWRI